MYEPRISGAVVVGDSYVPYLLIGKQGTKSQGKIFVQGLTKPIPFKDVVLFQKNAYVAAVLGVFSIPIPASPVTGSQLQIKEIGVRASRPETSEKTFINANIADNESLTDLQWQTRIITACNNNKAFAELFVASAAGGSGTYTVVFTQVTAGIGEVKVKSSVNSIVVTNSVVGAANKGMTGAQVATALAVVQKEYPIAQLGSYTAASDNFDVYTIVVSNFSLMHPFGFRENKPEVLQVICDTTNTAFEAQLESIFSLSQAAQSLLSCTTTDTGDVFTVAAHGLIMGQELQLSSVTTTTGLTVNKKYYVNILTADTFTVSATVGGAVVAITSDGSCVFAYQAFKRIGNYGTASFTDGALVASTGAITKAAHGLIEGQRVYAQIPTTTGLAIYPGLPLYVKYTSTSVFALSLTSGGAALTGTTNSAAVAIYVSAGSVPSDEMSGDAITKDLIVPQWIS